MGKEFEVELFEGKNTALLHLRIPQAMNSELLLEAKKKGVSVSDIVRDAIRMNLAPKVLGRQVEKGFELAEGENRLDGVVDYYADLSNFCEETEAALRRAQAMKETVKRIHKLVESKFQKVFDREIGKMKLLAEENDLRRRQEEAAGLRSRQKPLPLKKKALTPVEMREQALVGIENE